MTSGSLIADLLREVIVQLEGIRMQGNQMGGGVTLDEIDVSTLADVQAGRRVTLRGKRRDDDLWPAPPKGGGGVAMSEPIPLDDSRNPFHDASKTEIAELKRSVVNALRDRDTAIRECQERAKDQDRLRALLTEAEAEMLRSFGQSDRLHLLTKIARALRDGDET